MQIKVSFSSALTTHKKANMALYLAIFSVAFCWIYGLPSIVAAATSLFLTTKIKATIQNEEYLSVEKKTRTARIIAIAGITLSLCYWMGWIIVHMAEKNSSIHIK